VLACSVLWLDLSFAVAQTIEAWPQFQGGPEHLGTAAGPTPPYRRAWEFAIPRGGPDGVTGTSGPVYFDGLVVAAAPEAVIAVDAVSGEERWRLSRDGGPPASPAIGEVDGRPVLLYTEGEGPGPDQDAQSETGGSRLMAIDPVTQETLWDPVELKGVTRTGVTVSGPTAYVGDDDGNVYAIDLGSGTMDWTVRSPGSVRAPIAVSGDAVVVSSVQTEQANRAAVVRLDAEDGERLWDTDLRGAAVAMTAPSIAENRVYVGASGRASSLGALDLETGREIWRAKTNAQMNLVAAPAVSGDAVVTVDVVGQVYRFDAGTGVKRWDFALNQIVARSPVAIAGGFAVVPSNDGVLFAIDLATGLLAYRSGAGDILRNATPAGQTLVAVRGGASSGLEGFSSDPSASLLAEPSPTAINPGRIVGWFLLVSVAIGLVLVLAGRFLLARLGPAFPEEDQPVDPLEGIDERS
jgi:outer membrane protein assembly factor BamB